MYIYLWYCPKCDRETNNWRTCPVCGGKAVFQKFMLWPAGEEKDHYEKTTEEL